jgi:hypothetical protein
MSQLALAPRNPIGPAPLRQPGSVRRTTSIDMTWPEGRGRPLLLSGRARDLLTPADGGAARVLAADEMEVLVSPERVILSMETQPPRPGAAALVGVRGGGKLRGALEVALPEEKEAGTGLYLLIDDIAGASLISGWAWSRWDTDWMAKRAGTDKAPPPPPDMRNVCIGFRPGSSALGSNGSFVSTQNIAEVGSLVRSDDPEGWHALAQFDKPAMRRARRIDVWVDDVIRIDAGFQDSATTPRGAREAVHEYHLTATADPVTLELLSVHADPRILPFGECPAAVANVSRLLGVQLGDLRREVVAILPGTAGCTHLNDALRALAEVPALLRGRG